MTGCVVCLPIIVSDTDLGPSLPPGDVLIHAGDFTDTGALCSSFSLQLLGSPSLDLELSIDVPCTCMHTPALWCVVALYYMHRVDIGCDQVYQLV